MKVRATTLKERVQPTRLGNMLRMSRMMRGLGLRDVAQEIGIGYATLMRIEHGQSFDVATLMKLWNWLLSVSVDKRPEKIQDVA